MEIYLIVLRKKEYIKLEKAVWITTLSLVVYFVIAVLLDPRYSFWHLTNELLRNNKF